MINLYESELLAILPDNLKDDYKVQAFCYAFDNQMKKFIDKCEKLKIWSNLDEADESLLDYLAVELRTQYYQTSMDTDTKRKLIKNTLPWYQKAGTVAAVEELMTIAFGEGEVQEWYDYGGNPHYFKIITENSTTVDTNAELFLSMLNSVKRKSAKLESIEVISSGLLSLKYAIISRERTRTIY